MCGSGGGGEGGTICDRRYEKGPFNSKSKIPVEAKLSHTVTRRNVFTYTRGISSMSPTSRRAVRVQKHIIVSE